MGAAGGEEPAVSAKNESWNGTSWTEVGDLNTARYSLSGTGGSNTNGLVFGGTPPVRTNTEVWNGSSWTELSDLATARQGVAPGSSFGTTDTFAAGGYPGSVSITEEWNVDAVVSTVTTS